MRLTTILLLLLHRATGSGHRCMLLALPASVHGGGFRMVGESIVAMPGDESELPDGEGADHGDPAGSEPHMGYSPPARSRGATTAGGGQRRGRVPKVVEPVVPAVTQAQR